MVKIYRPGQAGGSGGSGGSSGPKPDSFYYFQDGAVVPFTSDVPRITGHPIKLTALRVWADEPVSTEYKATLIVDGADILAANGIAHPTVAAGATEGEVVDLSALPEFPAETAFDVQLIAGAGTGLGIRVDYLTMGTPESTPDPVPGPVGEPPFSTVVALAGFDSTPLALDVGPSLTGSTNSMSSTPKFGAGAFAASGGDRITGSDPSLAFGVGDYTAEVFVNVTTIPTTDFNRVILALHGELDGTLLTLDLTLAISVSGTLIAIAKEGTLSGTTVVETGRYYHLAVTRTGGVVRLFVDGVLEASLTADAVSYDQTHLSLGGHPRNMRYLTGHIDEFRLTKGVARYTEAFTPPSEAFPRA
jgi:hypothetical protein